MMALPLQFSEELEPEETLSVPDEVLLCTRRRLLEEGRPFMEDFDDSLEEKLALEI